MEHLSKSTSLGSLQLRATVPGPPRAVHTQMTENHSPPNATSWGLLQVVGASYFPSKTKTVNHIDEISHIYNRFKHAKPGASE